MTLLCLLILLAMCGTAHGTTCGNTCGLRPMSYSTSRIVGGVDVLRGSGAWAGIVSIQGYWSPRWASHVCGGTLITPSWVLTAAHCFINRTNPLHEWAVLAGATMTTDLGGGVQVRRIKQVIIHENYDKYVLFDIAVLELEKPIECSPTVQLACLPDPSMTLALQTCYIAGWGDTYVKAQGPRVISLREAKVPVISNDICNRSDWNAGTIQEYNVCAGYPEGGVTTCQGDSGGPLVCKDATSDFFWQIGITSWAFGCARPKKPGVSTSTQYFYNWIVEKISQSSGAAVTTAPAPVTPVQTPARPCPFPREKLLQFFSLLNDLLKLLQKKTA